MFEFFLVVLLLIPVTMIGLGLLWKKHPPKTVNMWYGYRTSWSMKSKDTWDFAHRYCSVFWIYTGVPLGIISILLLVAFKNSDINILGIIVMIITLVQLAGLSFPIVPTEIALRKRFDTEGKIKTIHIN